MQILYEKGVEPMKKSYGICFFALIIVLGLIYYVSYKYSMVEFQKEQEIRNNEFAYLNNEQKNTDSDSEDSSVAVDTTKDDRITNRTIYILEHYNSKDFSLTEETLATPADFVGLTREGLIEYLKNYENSPSLEDLESGFEKFELVSFSKDTIVLRKTFYPMNADYKYYLIAENNYITVYYMDKKTVFSYTDILLSSLPEEIQQEIISGKYATDIHQLYNFLENYSS